VSLPGDRNYQIFGYCGRSRDSFLAQALWGPSHSLPVPIEWGGPVLGDSWVSRFLTSMTLWHRPVHSPSGADVERVFLSDLLGWFALVSLQAVILLFIAPYNLSCFALLSASLFSECLGIEA